MTATNTYIIEFRNRRIFKFADVAKLAIIGGVINFLNAQDASVFTVSPNAIEFMVNMDHSSAVHELVNGEYEQYAEVK